MRTALAVVAALAALVLPGAAAAQTDQSFLLFQQARTPNVSTNFNLAISLAEADQQKRLTGFTLKFAPGSRLDPNGAVLCTAPREERVNNGHRAACPPESEMGTGEVTGFFGDDAITADLSFWNVRGADDRELLNVEQVVNGNRLPPFSGTLGAQSITFPLGLRMVSLNATIKRSSRRTVEGERVAYLRTPPTCPASRRWKIRTVLRFEGGTTKLLRAYVPCKRIG